MYGMFALVKVNNRKKARVICMKNTRSWVRSKDSRCVPSSLTISSATWSVSAATWWLRAILSEPRFRLAVPCSSRERCAFSVLYENFITTSSGYQPQFISFIDRMNYNYKDDTVHERNWQILGNQPHIMISVVKYNQYTVSRKMRLADA